MIHGMQVAAQMRLRERVAVVLLGLDSAGESRPSAYE